jgi:60 kDa SS-A/Ro ribonucleoprotein
MVGKFNVASESTAAETVNYEGGQAFALSPPMELYQRVATCLVKEPKFYGKVDDEGKRILELIDKVGTQEPELILQLASHARNLLHLRSIPVALLAEASLKNDTKKFVKEYTPSIVQRADELTEVLSYISSRLGSIGDKTKGTMVPHSLQKGLQKAVKKFSAYALSKYDRDNASMSMKDMLRIIHAKPDDKQSETFKKIIKGELESAETWEHILVTEGSSTESWEKAAKIMPIMATLRNLRNLLDHDVSKETIAIVCQRLADRNIILNSKQFPYRFLSAYREIPETNFNSKAIINAVDNAATIAIENVPEFNGRTAVFGDNSGSMDATVSGKSKIRNRDIGSMLAAICSLKSKDAICGVFGQTLNTLRFSDSNRSVINRAEQLSNANVGHSTNAWLAISYLLLKKIKVDRIMIFSDEQTYNTYGGNESVAEQWKIYKNEINKECFLYAFNLAGYGTSMLQEGRDNVLQIGGWSEGILRYVPVFESDSKRVMDDIRSIKP